MKTIKIMLVLCTLTCAAVSAQTTKLHIKEDSMVELLFNAKKGQKIELTIKQNKSNEFVIYIFDSTNMIAPIFIVPVITSKHKIATQINDGAKTFLPSCEIYAGQTGHITLEFLEKDTKNLILRIQNIKPKEPIDAEIDIKKA